MEYHPRSLPGSNLSTILATSNRRCTYFVSAPGEHRQWDRDGHIDTNLAYLNLTLKLASRRSTLGEDGGPIAVRVRIDDRQSLIKRVSFEDHKDGAKDLLPIANDE